METSFSLDMPQRWMHVRDNWWGDYRDPPKSYPESSTGSLTAVWLPSNSVFQKSLRSMIHPTRRAVIKSNGSWLNRLSLLWLIPPICVLIGKLYFLSGAPPLQPIYLTEQSELNGNRRFAVYCEVVCKHSFFNRVQKCIFFFQTKPNEILSF